jgi:hypothetical protein
MSIARVMHGLPWAKRKGVVGVDHSFPGSSPGDRVAKDKPLCSSLTPWGQDG